MTCIYKLYMIDLFNLLQQDLVKLVIETFYFAKGWACERICFHG